jgi:hypothetical protein
MEVGIQDRVAVESPHGIVVREGGACGAQQLLGVAGRADHDHRLVVDAYLLRPMGFESGGSKDLVHHVKVVMNRDPRDVDGPLDRSVADIDYQYIDYR